MWKIALGVVAGFAAGVFVAKLGYEAKVRGGIGDFLDLGSKVGINLRGGFVESTIDNLAGVGTS
jgi:hypothetical protein